MKSVSLCFISFLILFNVGLPNNLANLSVFLRNRCEKSLPTTLYHDLNSALICGTHLENPHTKGIFQSTGLIHLIVVSGSHLLFLQSMIAIFLSKLFKQQPPFVLVAGILFFFTIMTGLQAPCVRALIQLLLTRLSTNRKLFWRPWQVALFSGIICLALFPEWLSSLSLLMSWACALALSLTEFSNSKLKQHTLIYFVLLPIISSLAIPHPLTIFINFVFVPVFGVLVFPMSLLVLFLPFLAFMTDRLWEFLIEVLSRLESFTPSLGTFKIFIFYQWLFLLLSHLFVHIYFVRRSQRV